MHLELLVPTAGKILRMGEDLPEVVLREPDAALRWIGFLVYQHKFLDNTYRIDEQTIAEFFPDDINDANSQLVGGLVGWFNNVADVCAQAIEELLPYLPSGTASQLDVSTSTAAIQIAAHAGIQIQPCMSTANASLATDTRQSQAPTNGSVIQVTVPDAIGQQVEASNADSATLSTESDEHQTHPNVDNHEQDIIDVISEAGRRLTHEEVIAALEAKHGNASAGMTKQRLSSMASEGRRALTNTRRETWPRGKGYGLPEWGNE